MADFFFWWLFFIAVVLAKPALFRRFCMFCWVVCEKKGQVLNLSHSILSPSIGLKVQWHGMFRLKLPFNSEDTGFFHG